MLYSLCRVGNERFDAFQPFRVDRAPDFITHLESVIRRGVVRGCDVHGSASLFVDHSVRNRRCGCCAVRKIDLEAVPSQDLRRHRREVLRGEAFVVSNHYPLTLFSLLEKIACKSLCGTSDIVKGVIFCNDTAPTICAESNFVRHKKNSSSKMITVEL